MAFSDWSKIADANSTVGAVNIADFCPPGNLNNGIREVMAQLRAAFSDKLSSFFGANSLADARTALKVVGTEGAEPMTANLARQGAGPHLYHVTPTFSSGRVFVTVAGAADPTSLPGDIWIQTT